MTTHPLRTRLATLFASAGVLLALGACASAAVTTDALEDRTSRALGLERGQFTISDRVDEGTATRYAVLAKSGRRYNCTVGGSFSVVGRVVSDAICTEMGKPAGAANSAPTGAPNTATCNALLRAAGKC
jgi:hypothetical protein